MSQFYNREEVVSLAQFCFKKGLYSEVIGYMKAVIKMETPLSFEEWDITFSSYIKLQKPFLDAYLAPEISNLSPKLREKVQSKAKSMINSTSDEVINLLDSPSVKNDKRNDAAAHYKYMKAAQLERKSDVASEQDGNRLISEALKLYEEASKIANDHLDPAHPLTLLIAHRSATIHYYLLVDAVKALDIMRQARKKAERRFNQLPEEIRAPAERSFKCMSSAIDNWSLN